MTVLFVAPLPPPLHGFSFINQAVFNALDSITHVELFDRAPLSGKGVGTAGRFWHWLCQVFRFGRLLNSERPRSVYIGLSGGPGQLFDLPFVALARLYGSRIYVHHHSFAYLNRPTALSRIVFKLLSKAVHIVLGKEMEDSLSKQYAPGEVRILSNLAFLELSLPDPGNGLASREIGTTMLTLGFLSNITAEKGIFEFFDCVEELHQLGIDFKATVAGPVAADVDSAFALRLGQLPFVSYVGPVYGPEKQEFFNSIDWLLFPTKYANEAEPVTVLEAMAAGVEVLAANRGCLPSMLANGRGYSTSSDSFRVRCVELIQDYVKLSLENRAARRKRLALQMHDASVLAREQRGLILKDIANV